MNLNRVTIGALLVLTIAATSSLLSQEPSPRPGGAHGHHGRAEARHHAKGEGSWLAGTVDERFATVARQLRGFDVAMVEVGYRYGELCWAGRDGNWDFAAYQIEKIRATVRNAIQRRPARGKSAEVLEGALPAVEEAIRARDPVRFTSAFDLLTQSCNACHKAELVPFVHVAPPSIRHSVVSSSPSTPSTR